MGINTEDHLLQQAKDELQAVENALGSGPVSRLHIMRALDAVYARFPDLRPLTCAPRC